jgi:GDPmannose 4,6-dehydratase
MSKRVALITGITGQDGSLMADLLLSLDYDVHGIIRRASNFNTQRVEHIFDRITLHYGDLTDMGNIMSIIANVKPDEIYNFAAMSHVKVSFDLENYTFQSNTLGILNILQSVRTLGLDKTKVYQASTSEMYGNTTDGSKMLTERSEMNPVSPYGISKLAAHHICNYYRDAYKMFVVSSVLLNHEGERRGRTFVTQKIAQYVGKFRKSKQLPKPLQLGNLNAKRDWGYAKDYVYGIYLMMQHSIPDNYLLATGEEHSVREFVELAFAAIGIEIEWKGEGENERGYNSLTGDLLVEVNPKYYRPIDIEHLIGDASKAINVLGWRPKTSFKDLVHLMVENALN